MEARSYDSWNGAQTVAAPKRRKNLWSRLFRAEAVVAPTSSLMEVSQEEFAHFEECMNSPQGPTPALIRGAELLRSLRKKNR
jgi:hypothetical protein